jgi:hypothetical protein
VTVAGARERARVPVAGWPRVPRCCAVVGRGVDTALGGRGHVSGDVGASVDDAERLRRLTINDERATEDALVGGGREPSSIDVKTRAAGTPSAT